MIYSNGPDIIYPRFINMDLIYKYEPDLQIWRFAKECGQDGRGIARSWSGRGECNSYDTVVLCVCL